MGEVRKINPYNFSTVAVDEDIKAPPEVMNFIGKCPSVYSDMTPEDAKRLRLENLSILNEIVNDVTVSANVRVQAIQAREKILKDLMGNSAGINQRSINDIKSLLSDDEDEVDDYESDNDEVEDIETDETDFKGTTSIDKIREQMLDDSEDE